VPMVIPDFLRVRFITFASYDLSFFASFKWDTFVVIFDIWAVFDTWHVFEMSWCWFCKVQSGYTAMCYHYELLSELLFNRRKLLLVTTWWIKENNKCIWQECMIWQFRAVLTIHRLLFHFYFYLEHGSSVKCFVSLQFLNLKHSVGLLRRAISPSQGRYLTQT
jgi:hypothetical protein